MDHDPTEIERMLETTPAMRPMDVEYVTRTAYQMEYGIFPHHDPVKKQQRPMALVAMHDKENTTEGGPIFTLIRQFHTHRIYKYFGLSWLEFLEVPCYQADLMFEITHAEIYQENRAGQSLADGLNEDLDLS